MSASPIPAVTAMGFCARSLRALKEEISTMVVEKGLEARVHFLGNKKDVYRYYQAMDYFLLPSFYEGLPGTAIEAQASGVPGIMSDTVTEESVVTDILKRRSIEEAPLLWAKEIMKNNSNDMSCFDCQERSKYAQLVKKASFDVKEQARKMQEFYLTGDIYN